MHPGLFGSLTKLCAKRDELVQKFVPRSRVGFFRNKRTRCTPWDPKVHLTLFVCIRYRLVALRNTVQNGLKKCKSSCHEVASECFATNKLDPRYWTKKLMFWCVSYNLGAFRTIWLPYETRCQTGRTSAKVSATKSRRNFLQ